MASIAGPIAPPLSPGVKRSTRKRQRPTFFAEEMAATPPPSSTRKHSSSGQRSTRPRQGQTSTTPTTSSSPSGRPRSELSQLHETVAGLRVQIESATEQMQELRSLVTMLADLYRRDQEPLMNEPALFSATSSEQSSHETDEMFSTTASEYDHDAAYDDNDDESDEWLVAPLSPL